MPSRKIAEHDSFVDPAILSFSKPTIRTKDICTNGLRDGQSQAQSPVMKADSVNQSQDSANHQSQSVADLRNPRSGNGGGVPSSNAQKTRERQDPSATATLNEPFNAMASNGDAGLSDLPGSPANESGAQHLVSPNIQSKGNARKNRRSGARKGKETLSQTASGIVGIKDLPAAPVVNKRTTAKGKGWRQTPLVEETIPTKAAGQQKSLRHKSRGSFLDDANGWATEDATDIQDLGDFDFESNLSKFDKEGIFREIRRDDTKADDERLVSFNRKAKPGTNGGRNLHYTENVLETTDMKATNIWKSEAGETEEDDIHDAQYSSGKGSKRSTSQRRMQSRRGSAITPLGLGHVRGISRTRSPRLATNASAGVSPVNGPASSCRASMRILSSNKPCTCVSPLQMLEIEQLCMTEIGMTEDMLAENAGRGIAEAILPLPVALNDNPIMLFLVGNHKSGARAVAGARQLRNRGLRVSLSVLGGEREEMLLEGLRKQLDIFKKGGGWIVKWDELQTKLATSAHALPDLIVDALFGMHVAFDELRTDDQAIAFEMIRWANRISAPILSVDVPSGLIAASGEITQTDSGPLVVQADYVVSLAAPKTALLFAASNGEAGSADWNLSVVDIGISSVAWRKYGTRRRHGVDFKDLWLVPLKIVLTGGAT